MNEDRAEHVAGIEAKIKRLEAEVDRAQERRDEIGYDPAADDPRTSRRTESLVFALRTWKTSLTPLESSVKS